MTDGESHTPELQSGPAEALESQTLELEMSSGNIVLYPDEETEVRTA